MASCTLALAAAAMLHSPAQGPAESALSFLSETMLTWQAAESPALRRLPVAALGDMPRPAPARSTTAACPHSPTAAPPAAPPPARAASTASHAASAAAAAAAEAAAAASTAAASLLRPGHSPAQNPSPGFAAVQRSAAGAPQRSPGVRAKSNAMPSPDFYSAPSRRAGPCPSPGRCVPHTRPAPASDCSSDSSDAGYSTAGPAALDGSPAAAASRTNGATVQQPRRGQDADPADPDCSSGFGSGTGARAWAPEAGPALELLADAAAADAAAAAGARNAEALQVLQRTHQAF